MQWCNSEVNSTLTSEYFLLWVLHMSQIPLTGQTTEDNLGFLSELRYMGYLPIETNKQQSTS